jgi:beta-glucosidase
VKCAGLIHTAPGTGIGKCFQAYVGAKIDVEQVSLEEKQNVSLGISPSLNGCNGHSGRAFSIGFPGVCLQDGPIGVHGTEFVTFDPSGIHIEASFSTRLALDIAEHMGKEFRAKDGIFVGTLHYRWIANNNN